MVGDGSCVASLRDAHGARCIGARDTGGVATSVIALVFSAAAVCVALYSAVNARRALDWQRRRDDERRGVQAHIDIEHAMTNLPRAPVSGSGNNIDDGDDRMRYRLTIAVVNDSEQVAIFVHQLDVLVPERWSAQRLFGPWAHDERLEPGERLIRELDFFTLQELARYRDGLVVVARLTSGNVIERTSELQQELLEHLKRLTGGSPDAVA